MKANVEAARKENPNAPVPIDLVTMSASGSAVGAAAHRRSPARCHGAVHLAGVDDSHHALAQRDDVGVGGGERSDCGLEHGGRLRCNGGGGLIEGGLEALEGAGASVDSVLQRSFRAARAFERLLFISAGHPPSTSDARNVSALLPNAFWT